ncbi:MAG: hypothetical protein KatS3mg076_0076 [Candidatus Binatia bacterium]|nr:MAG: hypothetical protein KatS3mg076_0076 [Candidatus Binatia bacterium]
MSGHRPDGGPLGETPPRARAAGLRRAPERGRPPRRLGGGPARGARSGGPARGPADPGTGGRAQARGPRRVGPRARARRPAAVELATGGLDGAPGRCHALVHRDARRLRPPSQERRTVRRTSGRLPNRWLGRLPGYRLAPTARGNRNARSRRTSAFRRRTSSPDSRARTAASAATPTRSSFSTSRYRDRCCSVQDGTGGTGCVGQWTRARAPEGSEPSLR